MKKKVALIGSFVIILPLLICLVVYPLTAGQWSATCGIGESYSAEITDHGSPSSANIYYKIYDQLTLVHNCHTYIINGNEHDCWRVSTTTGLHEYVVFPGYDLFGYEWECYSEGDDEDEGYANFVMKYPYYQ